MIRDSINYERTFFKVRKDVDAIKFYAQKELDELYCSMRQKPYKKKNKWQRFLSDDASRLYKKKKQIQEFETSLEILETL